MVHLQSDLQIDNKTYRHTIRPTGKLYTFVQRVDFTPGGGTLILSYVGLGRFGFKILNFNIFGGFQKNKYFLGMKILWIFFRGHHKIGLYLGVISMHFS